MKKVLLLASFLFVLAGCGHKAEEKVVEKTTENKPVEVKKEADVKEEIKKEVAEDTWKVLEKSSFKIKFPKEPVSQSNNVPVAGGKFNLKMDTYMYQTDDVAYIVNVSTYPVEMGELSLDGSLAGMIQSNGGNEVISSGSTIFEGNKAMDFKLKNKADGKTILQGKLILVDRTMYQLLHGYTGEDNFNKNDFDKFMNSFEIIKK